MTLKVFEKDPNAWYHNVESKNRTVEFFTRAFEETLEKMSKRYE